MADKERFRAPTHHAYSVNRREGQGDFWVKIGLVFPHQDGDGFDLVLQALPLSGKIVCRGIVDPDDIEEGRQIESVF